MSRTPAKIGCQTLRSSARPLRCNESGAADVVDSSTSYCIDYEWIRYAHIDRTPGLPTDREVLC